MNNMDKTGGLAALMRTFLLPGILVAAGLAAFSVDYPVAQWCAANNCPRFFDGPLQFFELFGHLLGVILAAVAVHQLDPARRWALPRLLTCAILSGLAADTVKLFIVRTRPYKMDFSLPGNVWSTFGDWLPLWNAGGSGQSFPSGHTATAVGLFMALLWLYPAGRRLFPALVVLVACQRVESCAHYLSDVLFGGALGYLVATVCLRSAWVSGLFDRWERRWKSKAL
jgi:membrane-associated phospholipid phosphatase